MADLAVQEKVHEDSVEKRTPGSSKKVNFGGDGELVSSTPSFSGVIS